MSSEPDRAAVVALLRELGARLAARSIEADVYIVGGAAMLLAYNRAVVTRDIDAVTEQQAEVEAEAQAMAVDRGDLDRDWFNGRVKPLLPHVFDAGQVEAFHAPGITVSIASPTHLLAMKVRAARGLRDLDDIALLSEVIGIQSLEQIWAIADEVWGPGMVRDESRLLVGEFLLARGMAVGDAAPATRSDTRRGEAGGFTFCSGATSAGAPCSRRVAPGTRCWQHRT